MSYLLAGDSLAVGLSDYLHATRVDAAVGRSSSAGAAAIRRHRSRRVVVSLGANDDASQWRAFRHHVRVVLHGRACVIWLTVPSRPRFNRVLRKEHRRDHRLHVLATNDVYRLDGVHPGPRGYRQIARRARRVLLRHDCQKS